MSGKKSKEKNLSIDIEKHLYEMNPAQPIKYDDNQYIDIELPDRLIKKAKVFSIIQMISHNVMINYLIRNKNNFNIYSKLLYKELYSNLQKEATNLTLPKSIKGDLSVIYKYIKNTSIPNEIFILSFMNAERLYKQLSDSAKYSSNDRSFTLFATRIYKIKSNSIYIKGFGKVNTEEVDKSIYDKAVTIKITKSKFTNGYFMELGKLTSVKPRDGEFDIDNIDHTYVDEYGNKVFVAKAVEL